MTHTTQFCSSAVLNETDKDSDKNKQEAVEDIQQLLTFLDGLNNLYDELSKLAYGTQKKKKTKH
jgi:hypothetical protein